MSTSPTLRLPTDTPPAAAPTHEAATVQSWRTPLELLFEKRRESWRLDDCKVELDELPQIGTFVEIEGASEDTVQAAREKLGLGDEASITEGYASMVSRKLGEAGARELRFG